MANKRFGWHSGALNCRNVTVQNDLTIEGDLSFGDAITDTLTCNGLFKMGTNASPLVLTAGTPTFTLYTTNAGTSGATNAEPFLVKSVLTGAGQVGGRSLFHASTNVAAGGWINALKAKMEFGASGRTTGLASALCAETILSAGTTGSAYCALEGELVLGSGASTGERTSFIYLNTGGVDAATFDTNGYLFHIGDGITAGSGKFCSANYLTLKCFFTDSTTTRYLFLSSAEDVLSVGTYASPITFTTDVPLMMVSGEATADQASGVTRCAWFRSKVSDDQTANSILGIEAQCRVNGAATSANTLGAGQFTGIWAYFEQSGTTALNSGCLASAASCTVEGASLTIDSGAILAGVVIDSSVSSSAVTNGTFDAMYIKKASGALDFVSGIEFTDCVSSEIFKFADDGTIVSVTNGSILNNISGTTNAGFIRVMIGSLTRYIAVFEAKA